jgi:hypothetical protein
MGGAGVSHDGRVRTIRTQELVLTLLDSEFRRVTGNGYVFLELAKAIVCADGFKMSVQASRSHYCSPRIDEGPWYEFEVGYPSAREEALMPFVEDAMNPTGTVYACVPLEAVDAVIDKHGGMTEESLSKSVMASRRRAKARP